MPIGEMLVRMSSEELTYWQAYYALEPWGEMPEFYRNSRLLAILHNINRGESTPAVGPEHYMPDNFKNKPLARRQSPEEMIEVMRKVNEQQKPRESYLVPKE